MKMKRQYEISLANFATDFQYLTTRMEHLLYEHPQSSAASVVIYQKLSILTDRLRTMWMFRWMNLESLVVKQERLWKKSEKN